MLHTSCLSDSDIIPHGTYALMTLMVTLTWYCLHASCLLPIAPRLFEPTSHTCSAIAVASSSPISLICYKGCSMVTDSCRLRFRNHYSYEFLLTYTTWKRCVIFSRPQLAVELMFLISPFLVFYSKSRLTGHGFTKANLVLVIQKYSDKLGGLEIMKGIE